MAEVGDSVEVHYVGTLDDGTQFDASRDRGQTLDFVIGAPGLIAGFDQGVRGMAEGEIKTVRIEPPEAYGEILPELVQTVELAVLPEGIEVGSALQDPTTGRQLVVTSITEDSATLDANHPLAGQTLTFELEMVAINP